MSTEQNAEYVRVADRCPACLESFTVAEWAARHSDAEGEDVHEFCCDVCHGDDTDHRSAPFPLIRSVS